MLKYGEDTGSTKALNESPSEKEGKYNNEVL